MPTSCLLLRIDGENFDYEDNQMRVRYTIDDYANKRIKLGLFSNK